MIEPLRLQISLDCGCDHAFATWTERFGRWWPRAHSVSGDPMEIVLEPGETASRIEIVQSGWERLGADAVAWRDANQAGWNGLLPHFVAACGPIEPRSRTNKEPTP